MGKLATSHERLAHEKKAVPGKRPENRIAMNDEESPSKIVKRRTKTGCLTCRHRRVKCGEEKPICFNCVKSKRTCQGYGQRVVFKDPVGVNGMLRGLATHNYNQAQPPAHEQKQQKQQQQQQQKILSSPEDISVEQSVSPVDHNERSNVHSVHDGQIQVSTEPIRDIPPQHPRHHTTFTSHYCAQDSNFPSYETSWDVTRNVLKQQLHRAAEHSRAVSPVSVGTASKYDNDMDTSQDSGQETALDGVNRLRTIMTDPNRDGCRLRTFSTHLNEPNILASYRPTFGSSPLNDPKTAKVFAHFVHSVGPQISVFERHPVEIPIMLGTHIPASRQGLWTYTLALQALEHPALLQAILAISSLHISFLQRTAQTVSLKHYHYALKRVGSAVGLPTRRQQYGTLAATLLLGYYEVVAADHNKWNSHVAGSAHLVREIDYARMTRDLRQFRRNVQVQRAGSVSGSGALFASSSSPTGQSEEDPFAEKEGSIDQHLIGTIMGRAVNYDEFGRVEDGSSQQYQRHFTAKDIETFRIQCDLYWWYCKQDLFQSIISGNKLFTPFYQWGQCPPRAGIGRLDAVYGTADHLWLLLGRLTDFGYRDRKRKLKAINTSGTDWKPNPEFFKVMGRFSRGNAARGPPPPPPAPTRVPFGPTHDNQERRGADPPPTPQPKAAGQGGSGQEKPSPPMYGMVPPRGPVRLPSGFVDNPRRMEQLDRDDDGYEDATYNNAEDEWESILSAFDSFAEALGRDFMQLSPDAVPPISTPFGPSLQYRTQTIAILWAFYYTGRIILLRLHPSMPPAMMVAAGAAASATAEYARTIGRIAAGVFYPHFLNIEPDQLNPSLGSCLIEMTPPLFFAGVQYTDAAQRTWTVVNLRNVSRLTGWKSSESIATGCERSWFMAWKQGRGPPYQSHIDERLPFAQPLPQQPKDDQQSEIQENGNPEKRFVTMSKARRIHWAMGILSLEDDI